ncbi:MAG: DoxX family protein [Pseudomonadota bacterium]|jgi:putative oxidoreductase
MSSSRDPARNRFDDLSLLLARLAMVALFLPAGIGKIGGFSGTVGHIGSVGLPLPVLGATIAIAVEVAASLALLAGYRTRVAALVLAAFTLAATLLFHAWWAMPVDQQFVQRLMFSKNIAVVGGLLALAVAGAGRFGLDTRRARA